MSEKPTREIRMSEEEAWRIYRLLEEMNDFLHQRMNYPGVEDIHRWLETGIYKELADLYYKVVGPLFPIDEKTGYVIGPSGRLYDGKVEVHLPAEGDGSSEDDAGAEGTDQ